MPSLHPRHVPRPPVSSAPSLSRQSAAQRAGLRPPLAVSGLRAAALALCCLTGALSAQAQDDAARVVEVKPGDTFSAIAGRITGNVRQWRQLYRPQLSGLSNPNRIQPGMRFELVTDAKGARYLRLAGSTAVAAAAAPAPAPAPATAAAPAPAPAPTRAQPSPAATADAAVPAAPVLPGASVSLTIGVLPNVPAPVLQAQYDNLKRYLERVGNYKVRVVLPATFKAFYDANLRGEFDLSVAAPHFARVAHLERSMVPLVTYEPRINALFVTPIEGGVKAAAEVKDRAVAFANPTSLVAMYGQQWLSAQKLEAGKDYEVKSARTDMGVGRMLLIGEASGAIMSNGEFRSLPADESGRLRIVEVFARIPNFIVAANPNKLSAERQARLKAQLKAFLTDGEEGAAFAKATGFTAISDVSDDTLRELDPYVPLTRRVMGPVN